MRPVNVIKFRHDAKATLMRHWRILIDKAELVDLLEQALPAPAPRHWSSKDQALVNLEELRKSMQLDGVFELRICANCAAAGYRNAGDLDLRGFRVTQDDQFVVWQVQAPGHQAGDAEKPTLEFRFHRPQYIAEVTKVLERNGELA